MATLGDMMAVQFGGRIWPKRITGLSNGSLGWIPAGETTENGHIDLLLGHCNPAYLKVGTSGANGFILTAGSWIPGKAGANLTLTITTGAGALAVTSNGLDISVVMASGASHAATIITAINAQFSSSFVKAAALWGGAGGSNVSNLAKTNFVSDNRTP